ncbi:MAG: histidine kinase dimerization/phosphoacceptor domain -containing protein [Mesorhizobium sp.]
MRIPSAIEKFRFNAVSATATFVVAFFLLFVVLLAYFTFRSYDDTERRSHDRAYAASQVVAIHAKSILDLSSQTLKRIDAVLGHSLTRSVNRTELLALAETLHDLPLQVKTYIINADGETLYSTDPIVKPIDIRDREYFREPASGKPLHISAMMISRLNGQPIFTVSSRIVRDGEFAGVAVLSFDVSQFSQIAESLELDPESAISFVRNDGAVVARYPMPDEPLNISSSVLFTTYLPREANGTYRSISAIDEIDRIVGYRRVADSDLIAVASISTKSAMMNFWRNTLLTFAFALPAACGLMLAGIWIGRLLLRDSNRRAELTRALELNRLLFRDTHHRVKNNLQSVQSLVRMQAIPPEAKLDLQRRIAAMTAVHEHMYRADQFVEVDAAEFIPAIVTPLVQSFDSKVAVDYDIEQLTVSRDHTTALALLVNEIVTNSLKYAFGDRLDGRIKISLNSLPDNRAQLKIKDDGPGFDPETTAKGMGSRLIAGMMQQLGGNFDYRDDGGTIFLAEIALKDPVSHPHPTSDPGIAKAAE